MATFEDELLQDAEDDARTIEYIKNYLPQDLKDKFSDEELYYFLDVIGEYYVGVIDAAPRRTLSSCGGDSRLCLQNQTSQSRLTRR